MKNDWFDTTLILFLVAVLFSFMISFLFLGCNAPDRKDFQHEICYQAAYCRWLKAKEKSDLSCADDDKECRTLERYTRCKDDNFRWKNQDPQNCLDKLNGK